MTINVENIAAQVRQALDDAEARLEELRSQRLAINAEIRQILDEVKRLTKLDKAVTPKDHDGDGE